jgi:MFS family permease
MFKYYLVVLVRRNIILIIISSILASLSAAFFTWMLPIVLAELGPVIYLGLAYTVAYAISAPLSLISGVLADDYGRKLMVVVSTLFVVAAYGMIFLYPSIITLLVAIVIREVSNILSMPATNSLIAESVEGPLRGHAFTVMSFASSVSLAVGSLILGELAAMSLQVTALIILSLSTLSLLARLLLRETLTTGHERSSGVGMASRIGEFFKSFSNIGRLKSLGAPYIYLSVMAVLSVVASTLYSIYMSVYFNFELGLSKSDVGLIYTVSSLASLTIVFMGLLVSALGALRSLQLALLLMALPTITLAFLPRGSLALVLALVSTSTLASTLSQVSSNTFISDFTPQDIRSTVFGSLTSVSLLASLAAPSLGAFIFSLSKRLVPLAIGALLALTLIFSELLKRCLRLASSFSISRSG